MSGSVGFPSSGQLNNAFPMSSSNNQQTNRPSFHDFNAFSSSNINSQPMPNNMDVFNSTSNTAFPNAPGGTTPNMTGPGQNSNQFDPFNSSSWQQQPSQPQGNTNVNSNSIKDSSNPFDLF